MSRHGTVVDWHRVRYSIAKVGVYQLHVALRQGGTELPGSPFRLVVSAGPASALSTKLPSECLPLSGVVCASVAEEAEEEKRMAKSERSARSSFSKGVAESAAAAAAAIEAAAGGGGGGGRRGSSTKEQMKQHRASHEELKVDASALVRMRRRGCTITLQALDNMGNLCTSGGARVTCNVSGSEKRQDRDGRDGARSGARDESAADAAGLVECVALDLEDGTYLLQWTAKCSGLFEAHILIDGLHILGSPTPLRLLADEIDLARTELRGDGLANATAGKATTFDILCHDRFGNATRPGELSRFELAMLAADDATGIGAGDDGAGKKKAKEETTVGDLTLRWKEAPPYQHESKWVEESQVRPRSSPFTLESLSSTSPPPSFSAVSLSSRPKR